MDKDFDQWNKKKQIVDSNGENKFYHARDIWWCAMGVNVGFEQDGTGKSFERPVVILRGFSKQVCLVVPLTTSVKSNPYHIKVGLVDEREACVIISQVRLIDTKRLSNRVGRINKGTFDTIKKAIKGLL